MNNSLAKRIRKEDCSARGKFIMIIIVSLVVGFVFGYAAIKIRGDVADTIAKTISGFLLWIAPYALNVFTIITAIATFFCIRKAATSITAGTVKTKMN